MSLGLIGECCGPCVDGGGGGPGGGGGAPIVRPTDLIADERYGTGFAIRLVRSGGNGAIQVGWSVAPLNECGCPHMIPTMSGTVSWGAGDMSDKFAVIPFNGHGPGVFYTCPNVPSGGESGRITLSNVSGGVVPWYPNGQTIIAVCSHFTGGNPVNLNPTYSAFRGSWATQTFRPNAIFPPFPDQTIPPTYKVKKKTVTINGVENYHVETTLEEGGFLVDHRWRGNSDYDSYPSFGYTWTVSSNTPTLWIGTVSPPQAGATIVVRIELSDPVTETEEEGANRNLADAKARFANIGGWLATCLYPLNNPPYDYPPTPGWNYVKTFDPVAALPFELISPLVPYGSSPPQQQANHYRDLSGGPFGLIKSAVSVDARNSLAGSAVPHLVELRVITFQYTNPDQTAYIQVNDTGWYDITDTQEWVDPPGFYGFKNISHRIVTPPGPPPPPWTCYPGYVP